MEDTNKATYVIDTLKAAGITTVKVDSPVVSINLVNDTVPVAMISRLTKDVGEGIQFIIEQNPVLVFIKDVIENQDGCRFRLQYITM